MNVTKFERLARYAQELIDTEQKKITKFIEGLNPIIMRDATGVVPPATFDEAVKRAYKFEDINNQIIWDRKQQYQRQQNKKPQQDQNPPRQGAYVHTVAKIMKLYNVVKPWALALGVGLWIMPFEIAHNYKTKAIGISNRGKQPLRIRHQLRIKQDHLSSSSNSKADKKLIIRMLILHSSSRIEMHKGGKIGHSSKDGHIISIVSMPMLRAM